MWAELVELLRDPDYIDTLRRMVERARAQGVAADHGHLPVEAVSEHAGAAVHAGVDPGSLGALAVIERVASLTAGDGETGDRAQIAERLETFTDRRVFPY